MPSELYKPPISPASSDAIVKGGAVTVFASLVEATHPARMLKPMPVTKDETPPWWFNILGAVWSNPMSTSASNGGSSFPSERDDHMPGEGAIIFVKIPQDLDLRQAYETC